MEIFLGASESFKLFKNFYFDILFLKSLMAVERSQILERLKKGFNYYSPQILRGLIRGLNIIIPQILVGLEPLTLPVPTALISFLKNLVFPFYLQGPR